MKSPVFTAVFSVILLIVFSCVPEPDTDYQAYMKASPSRAVFVLNDQAESMSAIDPASGIIYNNIQIVGWRGTNNAIPADIMIYNDNIHVLLSGQNSSESYDGTSLDYLDDGEHYFKNGYNPLCFITASGTSWVFVPGFETDEIQPLNLNAPGTKYGFVKTWEAVNLSSDAHDETQTAATEKNAAGDNHERSSSGGAVLPDGANSRLYVSNVRYDSGILLTDSEGNPAEYPAGSGKYVQAGGYFREATLSIFSFNADGLSDGASDSVIALTLVKEINLESLYSAASGVTHEYFPGDGLNPQSVFILDGRLNVICTGTNGGRARYYSAAEYIPDGYSAGDLKPGTEPDDGIVLVLDLTDPDNPAYLTHLKIGGSPVGFREANDTGRKIIYLAGIGGVQAYRYGTSVADYQIISGADDMILAGDEIESDYFSGLCYDQTEDVLYISFYSGDAIKSIKVSGAAESPVYSAGNSWQAGDGPGAMTILE